LFIQGCSQVNESSREASGFKYEVGKYNLSFIEDIELKYVSKTLSRYSIRACFYSNDDKSELVSFDCGTRLLFISKYTCQIQKKIDGNLETYTLAKTEYENLVATLRELELRGNKKSYIFQVENSLQVLCTLPEDEGLEVAIELLSKYLIINEASDYRAK
jgi:hypothetical protein